MCFCLQGALKCADSSPIMSVVELLQPVHICIAWLSYIHLNEFHRLPLSLFDPRDSGLGHIVSAVSTVADIKTV